MERVQRRAGPHLYDLEQRHNVLVPHALEDGHLALQALPQLGVELGQVDLLDGRLGAGVHMPRAPHNRKAARADVRRQRPPPHQPLPGGGLLLLVRWGLRLLLLLLVPYQWGCSERRLCHFSRLSTYARGGAGGGPCSQALFGRWPPTVVLLRILPAAVSLLKVRQRPRSPWDKAPPGLYSTGLLKEARDTVLSN